VRKLLQGIVDFHDNQLDGYRERFAALAEGQHPEELFIAWRCWPSRRFQQRAPWPMCA